jgi:hypothetical protein
MHRNHRAVNSRSLVRDGNLGDARTRAALILAERRSERVVPRDVAPGGVFSCKRVSTALRDFEGAGSRSFSLYAIGSIPARVASSSISVSMTNALCV